MAMVRNRDDVGTVRLRERRIVAIEVEVSDAAEIDNEAEYVLVVNGRMVKRMAPHQALRLGLVSERSF